MASTNWTFLAIPHQDELQIWLTDKAPKCVSRVTPESLGQKAAISCWAFLKEDKLAIGHKDGSLTLYDCKRNEV